MKAHSLFVIISLLIIQYACNSKPSATEIVNVNGNDVFVTHADQVTDTIELMLSDLIEDCEVVPLETNDESFISFPARVAISENYITIKDQEKIPLKLFDREGRYIRDIGAIGRGPDEYHISLYGVQIDEENENLYLFPFANARQILVFGFDGKAKTHIPLRFQQRKFKAYIEDGIVTILGMPFENDSAIVFQQTMEGKLIQYIPPEDYQLALEFSSEVISSKNAGSYYLFQMLYSKTQRDTLYYYNTDKNILVPKFTVVFDTEEWPLYWCFDLPNHYYISISVRGKIIIDKNTRETHYFRLINDFYGGIELSIHYLSSSNGMFISALSAVELKREIDRCLEKNQSNEMKKKLTDLDLKITENSNDILFIGKFK